MNNTEFRKSLFFQNGKILNGKYNASFQEKIKGGLIKGGLTKDRLRIFLTINDDYIKLFDKIKDLVDDNLKLPIYKDKIIINIPNYDNFKCSIFNVNGKSMDVEYLINKKLNCVFKIIFNICASEKGDIYLNLTATNCLVYKIENLEKQQPEKRPLVSVFDNDFS